MSGDEIILVMFSALLGVLIAFGIAYLIERIREAVETSGAGEKLEDIQNEMRQMRGRIEAMRMRARTKMHPRQLHMMLRNPSARSFKYQEGWRYLKNKMSRGEDNEKK